MKLKLKKITILTCAFLAITSIILIPILHTRYIIELYYIHKLKFSDNINLKKQAIIELSKIKSIRAIPSYIKIIKNEIEMCNGDVYEFDKKIFLKDDCLLTPLIENVLKDIGSSALDVILLNLKQNNDVNIINASLHVIRKFVPTFNIPFNKFSNLINNKNIFIRFQLLIIIEKLGANVKEAIPILNKLLDDDSEKIKILTIKALGSMGYFAEESIKKIKRFLNSKNYELKNAAEEAIIKIKNKPILNSTPLSIDK